MNVPDFSVPDKVPPNDWPANDAPDLNTPPFVLPKLSLQLNPEIKVELPPAKIDLQT